MSKLLKIMQHLEYIFVWNYTTLKGSIVKHFHLNYSKQLPTIRFGSIAVRSSMVIWPYQSKPRPLNCFTLIIQLNVQRL